MKKILLAGTALVGFAALATPAHAELKTDIGGFFRGYGVYSDNDTVGATSQHNFELRRDSEIHFNGEATLDNGLTVGAHTEVKLGTGAPTGAPAATPAYGDAVTTDEAYAYFSGGWGRVNFGSEDGAAYLLQVAAPSADSNVDGLRTYIQDIAPTRTATATLLATLPAVFASNVLDYDDVSDPTGAPNTDRITYLTPKFSGFQVGVSYAPTLGTQDPQGLGIAGPSADNASGAYDNLWEGSARWDGEFQGFGIGVGGGYSRASLEAVGTAPAGAGAVGGASDDYTTWNAGLNLTWGGFSLGGDYLRGTTQQTADVGAGGGVQAGNIDLTENTWVVGGGWDNGPYHVGASYLNRKIDRPATAGGVTAVDYDTDRWTVGGGYTYGPGMTFRGAAAFGTFDPNAGAGTSNDFTQVTVGTDIQF